MAALMFAAVCAYVGAAFFGGTDFSKETGLQSPQTQTVLYGIALRRESALSGTPDLPDAQRLSAASVSDLSGAQTAIYCSGCDGFEYLNPDALSGISADTLEELLEAEPSGNTDGGKFVYGFDWYFAAFLTQGEAPAINTHSRLKFTQNGSEANGRLVSVVTDGGRTVLVFRLLDFSPGLLCVRKTQAVIID